MMTSNGTAPGPRQMSNQILSEAAARMLPVLAGRLLAAIVERAVEKVEGLAEQLDSSHDGSERSRNGSTPERDDAEGGGGGRVGAAVGFLMEQARLFLAFVVRLAAQGLEMLRQATAKLRARRAPEGIDEAPAPEEISDPEELEDAYEDDAYEDEYDDEYEEYEDEEIDERAPARA
ncbi:hypothetical protein [Actinomycetospora chlora]